MKKCKNVWIFNHYAITPDLPGGTRHFEIGQSLAKRGYNVIIFASSFSIMAQTDKLGKERFRLEKIGHNFNFVWIKTVHYRKNDLRRILNMLSFVFRLYKVSKMLVKKNVLSKPDVIIGSTVHPFTPVVGILLAKVFSSAFIFEIRDLWPQTFIDMGLWTPRSITSRFFYFIERFTVARSDHIIVLSPMTIYYLVERYGINKKDITYLPNGVNLQSFKFRNNGRKGNSFKVLYIGALNRTNNLDVLIEAAHILKSNANDKNVVINIYGDGKEKNRLKTLKDSYMLNNVHFMGYVSKNDVPIIISGHDVLFVSTGKVYYGSENKLYEYLASGKPVIFSVWSRYNNLSKIGAGLYASPDDPLAVANAILRLKNMNKKERQLMGMRGRRFVEKYHDWNILASKLEKILK